MHGVHHLIGQPGRRPGQRGVGAHAAGVRPLVAVAGPLEVLRGQQRHRGDPVGQREQRHLRAVQELLDDHRAAAPPRAARAAARSLGDQDALARGQAVRLDHVRRAELVQRRVHLGRAGRRCAPRRSGCPAACMICLANDFEPSMAAARRLGPKQAMPDARSASATPATSGASGPITTRSARVARARPATCPASVMSTGCSPASAAMPGLPGAACRPVTSGSAARARASACSRPPEPRRRTRTAASLPALCRVLPAACGEPCAVSRGGPGRMPCRSWPPPWVTSTCRNRPAAWANQNTPPTATGSAGQASGRIRPSAELHQQAPARRREDAPGGHVRLARPGRRARAADDVRGERPVAREHEQVHEHVRPRRSPAAGWPAGPGRAGAPPTGGRAVPPGRARARRSPGSASGRPPVPGFRLLFPAWPAGGRRSVVRMPASKRVPAPVAAGQPCTRLVPSAAVQTSGRSWRVWSRRGPTPTAATGAPIMSSSVLT